VSAKPRLRKFLDSLPDAYYWLLILLVNLAARLPLVYWIHTQPYSDFANIDNDAILLSQGEAPVNLYATTHVAVTLIYGFLYRLFGADLTVIRIFHILVYTLAGLFAYAAGKVIFRSRLWATAAAVLLVSWPSLVFYSNVSTPEHLFILAECALIFLVAVFFERPRKSDEQANRRQQELIWFAAIGLLTGLSGLFRPFGELFLAAFAFTVLVYSQKRSPKEIAISLFCLFLPFWLVGNLPTAVIIHYQQEPPKNVRPCNLLVGMNFEAAGQYNSADRELCTRLRDEAGDEAAFTKRVIGFVWERLKTQKDGLIPFVNTKFAILWANSSGILFWALGHVSGGEETVIHEVARKANLMDFAIMLVITAVCMIGTVVAFFKDVKPAIFFCLLAFFGFNLMEIPLELQTRYRTVVMPLMIFFACWTFSTIMASRDKSQEATAPESTAK
jgi:4-amino-4-deoxy-L-arabinose transferase-like glycosyltransferase